MVIKCENETLTLDSIRSTATDLSLRKWLQVHLIPHSSLLANARILFALFAFITACASAPVVTPTPAPTMTLAPTATALPTSTPTLVSTATSTPAPTATATFTPTPTATSSPSPTKPPAATPTASLRYPMVKLREPQDGRALETKSFVFEWESASLQDGDHYEVFVRSAQNSIWEKRFNAGAALKLPMSQEQSLVFGDYVWTVFVVDARGQVVSGQGETRRIQWCHPGSACHECSSCHH
jgi:hypothetical protein